MSLLQSKPIKFVQELFQEFGEDQAFGMSAALAYYSIFSLPPILLIILTVAGVFFGEEAVHGEIFAQLRSLIGEESARSVQDAVASASQSDAGTLATVIGIGTLIFAATGVFNQLKLSLNRIWSVKPDPKNNLLMLLTNRAVAFGLVISLGFILLVSLTANAVVAALGNQFSTFLPDDVSSFFVQVVTFAVSVLVNTLLFAIIFKYLPDAKVRWSDVWVGALVTTLLFNLGKVGIGFYVNHTDVGSAFGSAGSLIVLLVWVYYSALILFFGAEFTYLYAREYGSGVRPDKGAVRVVQQEVETRKPDRGERDATPTEAARTDATSARG